MNRAIQIMNRIAVLLIGFLVVMLPLVTPPATSAADRQTYTFAVLPQQPPVAMHELWAPLIERLERELGVSIKLKLYQGMANFEEGLKRGDGDFVFSTPPQMVLARKSQNYIPLVRGTRELAGVLFVRRDSPIQRVEDLENTAVSFVGQRNLCSVITRHSLSQHQTDLNLVPLYSGSTSNVFKNVLLGKTPAGASLDVEVEKAPPEISSQLRTIMTTPKVAPHPVAAHPRVPKKLRERMKTVLLKLPAESSGRELLKQVGIGETVPADYTRDYRQLEAIRSAP